MKMSLFVLLSAFFICTAAHTRRKRYIFINPTSPITLALPTLAYDGRSWGAIDSLNMTGDDPSKLFYDIDDFDSLSTVASYFSHLQIDTLSCQERVICEFASNPEEYSPVAELVLKQLRKKSSRHLKKSEDSLMWRYLSSAREGFISNAEECGIHYPKCPFPAYKLLNMQVIKVWQYLAYKFNVQLL